MSDYLVAAREYLQATAESFWRWTDGGTILAWTDGETIAFLPEVQAVVQTLAVRGLPPFPPIVLALAACRGNVCDHGDHFGETEPIKYIAAKEVFAKLAQIEALSPSSRSDLKSKSALLDALFEQSPDRGTAEAAQEIVQGLAMLPPADLTLLSQTTRTPRERFIALRSLYHAFRNFDPENWTVQARTGLEQVPEAAPVDLPLNERVRQLLDSLHDDDELSGVARLAQNLLAAVYVPRPVSSREHLPVGGVSDLSNRGTLDRLLLSELAHDDLTLAVRVALNEALYLRREAPPKNPPNVRHLLLDSGLRMWGLPRVFGLAVALALAATTDKQSALYAFQTGPDGLIPVDLGSRAGLLAVLEYLTATIHPGESLTEFIDGLESSDAAVDAILITSDDTLDDPDFQRVLAETRQPLLAASVNRTGDYVLWAMTRRGRKQVASARLDLDELYHRPDHLRTSDTDRDLPMILSLEQFPLLLPHPRPDRKQMRYIPNRGVSAVTNDGRLVLWEKSGQAARQLTDRIPGKSPLWITGDSEYVCVVLYPTSSAPLRMLLENLRLPGRNLILDVPAITRAPRHIFEHRGQLFLLVDNTVLVLDFTTGHVLAQRELPTHYKPHFGRVFTYIYNLWSVCSFDGERIRFDDVRLGPDNACPRRLIGLVDCVEVDGQMGITDNGGTFHTVTGKLVEQCSAEIHPPLTLAGVSHDGRRALLSHQRGNVLVDVSRGSAATTYGEQWAVLEPEAHRLIEERTLRNHFVSAFINKECRLSLISRKQQALQIGFDLAHNRVTLSAGAIDFWPGTGVVPFVPTRGKEGTRYSLQVATGPNGGRVYLDSRGLLHLQPGKDQTEVTLVLCEGTMSGWNSLQQYIGLEYYLGAVKPVSAREFFYHVDQFAMQWR